MVGVVIDNRESVLTSQITIFSAPPTMSTAPINPKPFLQDLLGSNVSVRLKWNETEYRGKLLSVDSYMNIQLDAAREYIGGEFKGELGEMLIRCNNVLFIGKEQIDSDTKMEDA